MKSSKEILDKVLSGVIVVDDDDATLTNILGSCGVTEDENIQALETMRRKISVIYKRKPNDKSL